MDIWTVLKACARRWYVFLPILGAALWIGNAQVEAAPPVYTATSSAALTPPSLIPGTEPGEIIEVNPFQNLSGSMSTTTEIIVALMDSTPKREQFVEQGVVDDYEVSVDNSVIYFDVTGEDPAQVIETATRLVTILDTEVAGLQSKPVEAPESRIRAVPIAVPGSAEKDTMAGLRMLLVIGALGLVLATAAAVVVDGVLASRARRAARRRSDAAATSWVSAHGADDEPERPARPARPERGERIDGGERADRADRTEHAERVGRVAVPETADANDGALDGGPAGSGTHRRDRAAVATAEPSTDTVVIADEPLTTPAARHGRRA